jgi:colicin import membrane protein
MPRSSLVRWLSERTRTGIREMPSNAAWMLSRAIRPAETVGSAAGSATAGARDRGRKVRAAVVDATPVGGSSVDARMKRAREAAERAREAEEQAVEAAQESKDRSNHARQVVERGRARLTEADQEASRVVRQRVAAAQKAADESVKRERRAAQADAQEQREEIQAEVDEEIADAQRDAEESQRRAEELVADATEMLAAARRLADEATETARAVAEEAHHQAQQLADEADQQVSEADARIAEAEHLRERSEARARHAVRELDRDPTDGGLEAYKKPELVALAASVGVEGRTNMTKGELIEAIAKASRTTR